MQKHEWFHHLFICLFVSIIDSCFVLILHVLNSNHELLTNWNLIICINLHDMRLFFWFVGYAECKYFWCRNMNGFIIYLFVCFYNYFLFCVDFTRIKLESRITNKLKFNYMYQLTWYAFVFGLLDMQRVSSFVAETWMISSFIYLFVCFYNCFFVLCWFYTYLTRITNY